MNLPLIKKFFLDNFGKRCKDYDLDCYTCRRWEVYDELQWIIQDVEIGNPKEIKKEKRK